MKIIPPVDVDFGTGDSLVLSVPGAVGRSEHDLVAELGWGGMPDSNEVLEQHAGREAWWSARHVDETAIAAEWVETVYEPYMAHLRRYAIYALHGQGFRRDKTTKQDISDMVFQLFGETRLQEQRKRVADLSFLGYMIEAFDGRDAVQRLHRENPDVYNAHYHAFMPELFAYQQDADPVWVEEAIRRRIQVERSRDLLGAAVQAWRDRGFLLRQSAENEQARRNAIGGIDIKDLAKQVSEIIRKI